MTNELLSHDAEGRELKAKGEWGLAHFSRLEEAFKQIHWPASGEVTINGEAITKMDSAAAWLLISEQEKLAQRKVTLQFVGFKKEYQALLTLIQKKMAVEEAEAQRKPRPPLSKIQQVGKSAIDFMISFKLYLAFIGRLSLEALRIGFNPFHWRLPALATVIYRTGYQALPIIALLSFMIGVVITYQMGLQLKNYGANVYIVDLLGISILREFGPLLTAIMVAGRTGSAFTAQLGMMKLNQEIDALDTMGVTPAELLLLPRIAGLFIALPLLCMWANIFGVFGGMVMSNNMLGISWYDFLHRFSRVIPLKSLLIGIGKAPIFALIIASIGCFEGMQVEGSADSVGQQTTRSVVLSIFFIIVADAIFSVIFSELKL
jgi:phospholipid/cholesterol/gamma-HCH transport system permease protein